MLTLVHAGVVDDMHKTNALKIGIKYDTKPFGFKEGKTIKGFDLDLSKLIVEKIKKKESLPELKVFYKKVYPSNREQLLIDKDVDMVIATYTINEQRRNSVGFSKPYFKSRSMIVFRGELKNEEKVGILDGSSTETAVSLAGYTATAYPDYKILFNDFKEGKILAIASDEAILEQCVMGDKYKHIAIGDSEEYGVGLPKDDIQFKKLIDSVLNELKRNGEYDKLYRKWFK